MCTLFHLRVEGKREKKTKSNPFPEPPKTLGFIGATERVRTDDGHAPSGRGASVSKVTFPNR